MSQDKLFKEITKSFELHKNKYNSLVQWDSLKLSCKRLAEIGSIIGGNRLSKLLRNYCIDYKYWNHGMPDLVLWCKDTNRIKFSEVKSETDRLSDV